MATWIGFLRAVNVGQRKFPAADVRRVVESLGFTGVATHINTGNVRFEADLDGRHEAERALEAAFLADRGFPVPTIVFDPDGLRAVRADVEALDAPELERHYVYLLRNALDPAVAAEVEATSTGAGRMVVRPRSVHALLGAGYRPGVVDPLNAARLLGDATNRNARVIRAVTEKWA